MAVNIQKENENERKSAVRECWGGTKSMIPAEMVGELFFSFVFFFGQIYACVYFSKKEK